MHTEKKDILNKYTIKWELSEIIFQQSLSNNSLIYTAVSKQYGNVIFKILLNNGFDQEISALKLFQGKNFCTLYEYSLSDRCYMMEHIIPGSTLFEGTTREERIDIVSKIWKELHNPAPADSPFPTYLNWLEYGKTETGKRRDCDALHHHLEKAENIIQDISVKYPRKMLLHGDLHHENILKNKNGGYTVIDPKGVIGDPVFDLSRFILDEFKDDLTSEPLNAIIDFTEMLGYKIGIPCKILLNCLYAETAIWLFREELAKGVSLKECDWLISNMEIAYKMTESLKVL